MNEDDTITAEVYGVWLLQTMTSTPEGREFNRLKKAFDELHADLNHLEKCLEMSIDE